MKRLSFVLLAVCCAASLGAQTPGTPPVAPDAPAQAHAAPSAMARKAGAHPVTRPPASMLPPGKARLNTAERMAVMNNRPPLKELPAFSVTDKDGHAVSAKTMSHSTHWLLLYRRQNCLPCDRLMNVLAAGDSNSLKSGQPYVIVVAGKASDGLEKVRANYSTLSEATWLADKDDQILAALKPHGAPMIYAMDGHRIAWDVPGNLGDPATVEKMVSAWITGGEKSNSAAASTTTTPSSTTPGTTAAPVTQ
jgi:hypothetical protein